MLLTLGVGCGAHSSAPPPVLVVAPPPGVITDTTWESARRTLLALDFDDPGRAGLRNRIVAYLLADTSELLERGEYAEIVEALGTITALYTPSELGDGGLPAGLDPVARWLVEHGSPRGDEGRVLSGLLVLSLLHPDDRETRESYHRLEKWGLRVRATLNPLERLDEGLIEAWEEHARLMPTSDVLAKLGKRYVERRDAMLRALRAPGRGAVLSPTTLQGLQQTVLSVAALYLRHGDVSSAHTHVRALGPAGGLEERLLELLETARQDSSEGAGALLDLARAYQELGRFDVSSALCLTGLRAHRADSRFPQCLARVAADSDDFAGAMAWYGDAVRMAPDERALYDEILEVLNHLIEQGLFSADVRQTREIAVRATQILEERARRWPDSPPPVQAEALHLAIAIAEMNAGNAHEAEKRLRASLGASETVDGLLQLGLLLERIGRNAEALGTYERALGLTHEDEDDGAKRAEILERLGDSLRLLGEDEQASRRYAQGLAIWDENLARMKGRRIGLAQLRRGILLGRLARTRDAMSAFEQAMQLAPGLRETYATILAFLVVSEPDLEFAHRVFRHALNQLSLEPEWKVYFALWLKTIAGRRGLTTEVEVDHVLEDLSSGDDWWGKLARFAAGKLGYAELLADATTIGEKAEAHFYEGARRLASGDTDGARELFRRVLETHMVNFYEFAMAQELMTGGR